MKKLVPVIGLEIHVELSTKSKMFCQCSADWFGKEPNINICPVCLGYPGALPVPNLTAIYHTIKLALAFNCKINQNFKFDRKHYFYPDLPKGYQISQYDTPIGKKGFLEIDFSKGKEIVYKKFRIRRVHLEEDTGKLIHQGDSTLVDFNRAGVPLIEIVTEPDFSEVEEVVRFLEEVQRIVRWLGISDADMEKGSMRVEPNVSLGEVLPSGEIKLLDYKVELKNINSFRFAKKAIEYELKRQKEIFEKGEVPRQETRGYDEKKGVTFSQRVKETEKDYRYFPEPDIPRFEIEQKKIEELKKTLPVLPLEERKSLMKNFGIPFSDAILLTKKKKLLEFYKKAVESLKDSGVKGYKKKIANAILNKKISIGEYDVKKFKEKFLELFGEVREDVNFAKEVVKEVISKFSKAVSDYKKGKTNALMFLVGQTMREIKGKAKPNTVKKIIEEELKK